VRDNMNQQNGLIYSRATNISKLTHISLDNLILSTWHYNINWLT